MMYWIQNIFQEWLTPSKSWQTESHQHFYTCSTGHLLQTFWGSVFWSRLNSIVWFPGGFQSFRLSHYVSIRPHHSHLSLRKLLSVQCHHQDEKASHDYKPLHCKPGIGWSAYDNIQHSIYSGEWKQQDFNCVIKSDLSLSLSLHIFIFLNVNNSSLTFRCCGPNIA